MKRTENFFKINSLIALTIASFVISACQPSDEETNVVVNNSPVETKFVSTLSEWSQCSTSVCDGLGVQTRKVNCISTKTNLETSVPEEIAICKEATPDHYNALKTPLTRACAPPAGTKAVQIMNNQNTAIGVKTYSCPSGATLDSSLTHSFVTCISGYNFNSSTQQCEIIPSVVLCDQSYFWNGTSCQSISSLCAGGKLWDGYSCVDQPVVSLCQTGEYWDGTNCRSIGNMCPNGEVWTGSSCIAQNSGSTCQPGQYWDGTSCSNVDSAYSTLVSLDYPAGGNPTKFESVNEDPKVYTMYIGKSYDIAPVISSGIAVSYDGSDCLAADILFGYNGHISLSSHAHTDGQTFSCNLKVTNPVGLITTIPMKIKYVSLPANEKLLSVPDFVLHEGIDLKTTSYCPVQKTGTFTGGYFSIVDSSGTAKSLTSYAGANAISLGSSDACITTTYASGMWFTNSTASNVLQAGQTMTINGLKIKYTNGSEILFSNPFNLTYSRVNDDVSKVTIKVLNKFIHLTTDNRVNVHPLTGNVTEDQSTLPQVSIQATHTQITSALEITPDTVLNPNDSGHVSTTLGSVQPIGEQGTTRLSDATSTPIKEYRQTIFNGDYTIEVTNSSDAAYSASSVQALYMPSDGDFLYTANNAPAWSVTPGFSVANKVNFTSGTRYVAKQMDSNTGDLFAEIGVRFYKLGNSLQEVISKIFYTDSSKYDETLLAKRMPLAFLDAEDYVGIEYSSHSVFGSEKTDSNELDHFTNPVVRFGSKTFFMITKKVGSVYQKILAYRDSDAAIAEPNKTKIVLTPIPDAASLCGSQTCYPDFSEANAIFHKYGDKLVLIKEVQSNVTGTLMTIYAVFVIDPLNLEDPSKNVVYTLESKGTQNSWVHFSSKDGLVFASWYDYLSIIDLKTGNSKAVLIGNANGSSTTYDKYIKVGDGKYVIGKQASYNGSHDIRSLFVDINQQSAKFISINNNPSGFHNCILVGAGYDVTTGLKASFICSFGSGGITKLMSYLEYDGPGTAPYFVMSSNIKNASSDILTYQQFVSTFPNGNAIIMAAGDAQASKSSFYSVKHMTSTVGGVSVPVVKIKKINMTGDIGSEWSSPPSPKGFIQKNNKVYFSINDGYQLGSMHSYDDDNSASKTYYYQQTNKTSNAYPKIDEDGNIFINDRIIKNDDIIVTLKNIRSIDAFDFSSGKLLYFDDFKYYLADIYKNYEYQIEDVNIAYSNVSNLKGILAGDGPIVTIRPAYIDKARNYFIDLYPIQQK